MSQIYLRFGDETRSVELEPGKNILDYARQLDIPISSRCGGAGTCGECRVFIEQGSESLNERNGLEDKLKQGERLACQAKIVNTSSDIYATVLHYGHMQVLSEEISKDIELDPLTRKKGNNVVFDGEIVNGYRENIYGIAADIGTTTVVLHLMDLENGKTVSTYAFENPQREIDGDNVIARISYDRDNPGELQERLISYINREINNMPCNPHDIYEMVMVGNTTMRDLFFGLDVQSIGTMPFKSITEQDGFPTYLNKKAIEIGLNINPNANVYGASLIGSHVGADTVSACLAAGIFDENKTAILIDIGTNGEIVLRHKDRFLATSCAAGPALERTPGIEGAIQRISMNDGEIDWQTIGGMEPIGVCGSGMVDFLAEALRTGKMDKRGRFNNSDKFHIAQNVYIEDSYTRNDFLFGKGAISLGIKALLREAGTSIDTLEMVYLAGSYGNFIDPVNATKIGLIPAIEPNKILQIGNAAAAGAKEILLSRKRRQLAEESAKGVEHIALENLSDYGNLLIDELSFEEMRV